MSDDSGIGREGVMESAAPNLSYRLAVPVLFAALAVEIVALSWTGPIWEAVYPRIQFTELPTATKAAHRAARMHRSPVGMLVAGALIAVVVLLARRGAYDVSGRWMAPLILAAILAAGVGFSWAMALPFQLIQSSLSP